LPSPALSGPVPGRPWLPWLALPLILGAAGLAGADWWWVAVLAAPLAALVDRRWPWGARFLLALAGFTAGGWLAAPRFLPSDGVRVLTIQGTVVSVTRHGTSQGLVVTPERSDDPSGYVPRRILVRAPPLPAILPGDTICAAGGWLRDVRGDRLQCQELTRLVRREDGARGFAWRSINHLGDHAELAGSLLLGLGNPPEKALFVRTGLVHVLAVSGVHLALAAAMGAWLLFQLGWTWTWRQVVLGALLVGYTWLTAASPATVRALGMALAYLAYALLAREPHRLGPVSLAGLGLVLWDPAMARDLGFQLSLLAVLGIMTLGMDLMQLRARWLPLTAWPLDRPIWRGILFLFRNLADGILIGIAATLAILPLLVAAFGAMAPWSVLTSVLLSPPTTIALWSGLPLITLAGIWPDGPWEGLYQLVEGSLQAMVACVELADVLPGRSAVEWPPLGVLLAWPLIFIPCEIPWHRSGGPAPVPWPTCMRTTMAMTLLVGWWWF
jgi:ComEC/Rec2-related protein